MANNPTTDAALALSVATLHEQNRTLLTLRSSYWQAGRHEAALAVDDARNALARALHDLQRCDHE